MVKIITVHGTFAQDSENSGDKWWQKGSPFLKKLQDLIGEPLDILPFHWSGDNSEIDRRKAGAKLSATINACTEPPVVIGHSHGGSVGVQALLMSYIRRGVKARDTIRGFLTIGMPMILFKANRNPFSQFNLLGRLLFLVGIGTALISILGGALNDTGSVFDKDISLLDQLRLRFLTIEFGTAVVVFVILFLYTLRNQLRRRFFFSNRVFKNFEDRYSAFLHSQDEAVGALANSLKLKPAVLKKRSVFAGIFALMIFALIGLRLADPITTLLSNDDHYYLDFGAGEAHISVWQPPGVDLNILSFPAVRLHQIGDNPLDQSLSQRFYDSQVGKRLKTRAPMLVIPLSSIWSESELLSILSTPENAWLDKIRDSLPADEAFLFVPTGQETAAKHSFSNMIAHAALLGEEGYLKAVRGERAKAPYSYRHLFLKSQEAGFWREAGDPNVNAQKTDFSSMLIALTPKGRFSSALEGDTIPADTSFIAGQSASAGFDGNCFTEGTFLRGTPKHWPLCRIFYAGPDPIWRSMAYNYEDFRVDAYGSYLRPVLFFISDTYGFIEEPAVYDFIFPISYRGTDLASIIIVEIIVAASLSGIMALLLTPLLNAFVVSAIKNTAFGNTGFGERVFAVKPHLNFETDDLVPLPVVVENEMIQNSLQDAPSALQRIRELLTTGELVSAGNSDPLETATKFDDSELIHNAYFHSDEFIRHLATVLIEKYDLKPSESYLKTNTSLT